MPIGVLKKEVITFTPSLPDWKEKAIAVLDIGTYNKCYLRFSESFWPEDVHWFQFVAEEHGQWVYWLNLSELLGKPILVAFNAADFGRALESWSDKTIITGAMDTLRTMFGANIPEPIDSIITRWSSDPYAYGSYSYYPVGSHPSKRQHLAQPVDGRLFFAGEATHRQYFATVHGAYLSGIRAAEEIQALY